MQDPISSSKMLVARLLKGRTIPFCHGAQNSTTISTAHTHKLRRQDCHRLKGRLWYKKMRRR